MPLGVPPPLPVLSPLAGGSGGGSVAKAATDAFFSPRNSDDGGGSSGSRPAGSTAAADAWAVGGDATSPTSSCGSPMAGDDAAASLRFIAGLESHWVAFTHAQLAAATGGYPDAAVIGRGGCSTVYKGTLPPPPAAAGRQVAVKVLTRDGPDGDREFQTEVQMLGAVRHRHVASLIGYCIEGELRLLVYDLFEHGNLEDNLHDMRKTVLGWETRHQIAVDAARALEYLHCYAPQPIIHRDIKSSNILLGSNFSAKVSDFGLARWDTTTKSEPQMNADVVGTFGYLAPEYFLYGKVNNKTDVYSFGVVLLELLTGLSPIDVTRPKGQENLALWAKPLLPNGEVRNIMDRRLNGDYTESQARRMMLTAAFCLNDDSLRRPKMSQVVRMLEEPAILAEALMLECPSPRDEVEKLTLSQAEEPDIDRTSSTMRAQFMALAMPEDCEETAASMVAEEDEEEEDGSSIEALKADEYLASRRSTSSSSGSGKSTPPEIRRSPPQLRSPLRTPPRARSPLRTPPKSPLLRGLIKR
eukprot:SM000417S15268  [mRNA]  locus=s417:1138:4165:- [translate_table: standard]